jgi:hypothetical protein
MKIFTLCSMLFALCDFGLELCSMLYALCGFSFALLGG